MNKLQSLPPANNSRGDVDAGEAIHRLHQFIRAERNQWPKHIAFVIRRGREPAFSQLKLH